MSQIREVLSARAETVADEHEAGLRLSQVRGRIRHARRRRATGAAVVSLLLVAAVLGVGTSLGRGFGHGATPADLAGHPVPRTTMSLGYTYGYADSATGSHGSAHLHLDSATTPRLVRWASASSRGHLELRVSGGGVPPATPWVSPAGDFSSFVLIPAGAPGDVRLEQTGTDDPGAVALAVYTLRDPKPGPTRAGITFRERAPGLRLLGQAIGAKRQHSLTFPISATRNADLRLIGVCEGPANRFVEVRVADQGAYRAGCAEYPPSYDPIVGGFEILLSSRDTPTGPGNVVVHVVNAKGRPASADGVVRIAGAVYADDVTTPGKLIEADGHRWRLAETRTSAPGATSVRLRTQGDGRELLMWTVPGTKKPTSVLLTLGGHVHHISGASGGVGTFSGTYQLSGSGLGEVRMPSPAQRLAKLSVYELDD